MCTNPRQIRSASRFWHHLTSCDSYTVPCGQCDECRNNLSNDWIVRLYFEFKRYESACGRGVFATFTYNNKHLPKFYYTVPETNEVHMFPCFNSKDKDRFINSLRKHFERLGITSKTTLGIKYMWPSEYGECNEYFNKRLHKIVKGTHRPHYHPILFFPKEVFDIYNDEQLRGLIQYYWSEPHADLCKYWNDKKQCYVFPENTNGTQLLGQVRWSKDKITNHINMYISNDHAIRYAAKYCTKDINFFNQPHVKEFLEIHDDNFLKYNKLSKVFPRHWQSRLGSDIMSVTDDELLHGIDIHSAQSYSTGKQYKFQIPRLYRDKLLKTSIPAGKDGNGKDVSFNILNDRGYKLEFERFKENLHNSESIYEKMTPWYITQCVTPEEGIKLFNSTAVRTVINDLKDKGYFEQFDNKKFNSFDCSCWLRKHIRNAKLFFLYNSVFKNHYISYKEFTRLRSMSDEELIEFGIDYKRKQLSILNYEDCYIITEKQPDRDKIFRKVKTPSYLDKFKYKINGNYTLFNLLPQFREFDTISYIINSLENAIKARQHKAYIFDRLKRKQLKMEIL